MYFDVFFFPLFVSLSLSLSLSLSFGRDDGEWGRGMKGAGEVGNVGGGGRWQPLVFQINHMWACGSVGHVLDFLHVPLFLDIHCSCRLLLFRPE